ncbi:MAG: ATP-binding protein [Oscillospiraceae bacterium]|nr:ATP-binding protein [Oscillospiraceae bacterium]
MEPFKLEFAIDGEDFHSAGEASSETKKALKKLGIPADTIRRVSICMYEGEMNMVLHANGGAVTVEVGEDAIAIALADSGPGIPDIGAALSEGFSTATNEIRELGFGAGMGLPNMKKYCDEMDIQTELGVGTTVTMKINL